MIKSYKWLEITIYGLFLDLEKSIRLNEIELTYVTQKQYHNSPIINKRSRLNIKI